MSSLDDGTVKSILVVEDEPNIAKICYQTLNSGRFEVDIAVNGRIAQRMVETKRYALCLVDIWIPEMTGIDFFYWLRERHPELAKRVIFTTGDLLNTEITQFIEQSGMPFLPKPFTPNELQDVLLSNLDPFRNDSKQ